MAGFYRVLIVPFIFILASCTFTGNLDLIKNGVINDELGPNQGYLVLYKHERGFANALKVPVILDQKFVGEIGVKTYIKIPIDSGSHSLLSFNKYQKVTQDFVISPGETVYFRSELPGSYDFTQNPNFSKVDQLVGAEQVSSLRRIGTGEYASFKYYKKAESVPDGKAILYIYRPLVDTNFVLESYTPRLKIDGREVGQVSAGTFLELILDPGTHRAEYLSRDLVLSIELLENSINYLKADKTNIAANTVRWDLEFFGTLEPHPEILPTILLEQD